MNTNEFWLTKQGDGKYMLTKETPIKYNVSGQNRQDVYIKLGDPVGFRGMCKQFWELLFGIKSERFETQKIRVTVEVISEKIKLDDAT